MQIKYINMNNLFFSKTNPFPIFSMHSMMQIDDFIIEK